MLDHLEDPQNLGAVMRTADAAGVNGIIIPSHRAAGVTAAVRKVAAGAAERIPVAMVGNLNHAAEALKKEGYWLYAAEADGEEEYYRADYRRPLVLVVGSEGKGLSRLLRQNCDVTLSIPMPGTAAGSLNVAAATAVLVYAVLAQREGWLP
jgi:23S rRNA (guanosine2251-2'-O)-methyltransferase